MCCRELTDIKRSTDDATISFGLSYESDGIPREKSGFILKIPRLRDHCIASSPTSDFSHHVNLNEAERSE